MNLSTKLIFFADWILNFAFLLGIAVYLNGLKSAGKQSNIINNIFDHVKELQTKMKLCGYQMINGNIIILTICVERARQLDASLIINTKQYAKQISILKTAQYYIFLF